MLLHYVYIAIAQFQLRISWLIKDIVVWDQMHRFKLTVTKTQCTTLSVS